jgi:predicted transposase/invertase (TIGR01784 family)
MQRYLDPKTDIVFKKIFGHQPHLLISFLNAVLPLPEDGLIEQVEYLSNEQVPRIPAFKYTVVDVRCTDHQGRVFVVEMQIQWTNSFRQRLLFNASQAYVTQLEKGEHYRLLKPVYGLGLINTIFDKGEEWYHHYKILNIKQPQTEIKDLQLVFIELPKFKAKNIQEKKLQMLWLSFLSELDEKVHQVPVAWLEVPEIKQALDLAEEAAYTRGELATYDQYWDAIRVEKTLLVDSYEEGMCIGLEKGEAIGMQKAKALYFQEGFEEGVEKGVAKGIETGIEKGEQNIKNALIHKLLNSGYTTEKIALLLEVPVGEISDFVDQLDSLP